MCQDGTSTKGSFKLPIPESLFEPTQYLAQSSMKDTQIKASANYRYGDKSPLQSC
jgi:hypothetical protein